MADYKRERIIQSSDKSNEENVGLSVPACKAALTLASVLTVTRKSMPYGIVRSCKKTCYMSFLTMCHYLWGHICSSPTIRQKQNCGIGIYIVT